MSRPSHRPAASGAEPPSDTESVPAFGLGIPDSFETFATDAAPPPCAVDIGRAMTEGRRARRRRAARVTSGAALGLAVVCVVALVTGGSGAARPRAVDSAAATLPITGTNPFVVGARFGWLPDGVDQDSASLFHGALWLAADSSSSSASRSGGSDIGLSLRTFPAGFSEQSALAESATPATEGSRFTARPQAPIDGRPAYALTATGSPRTAPGFANVTLLWQMSNGRWAELAQDVSNSGNASGTDSTGLTGQARHVAETVTPDAAGSALPFSITGLPAGGLVTFYSLARQNASPTSWNTEIDIEVAGVTIVYDEGPVGEVLPLALGPSKCTTDNGLEACVTLASGKLSDRFAPGGLQGLADDVSLRGLAPASWTKDVFPSMH